MSALGLAAVAKRSRRAVLVHADTVRTARLPDATRLRLLHEAVASAISTTVRARSRSNGSLGTRTR